MFLAPVAFAVSVVPAWLSGGSFSYWSLVYKTQSSEYKGLSVSSQSIYAFLEPLHLHTQTQNIFFWVGLTLAAVAAVVIIVMMARAGCSSPHRVLLLSLVCVTLLPYLLPRMHERYFYLADIISVVYALYVPRRFYLPILIVGASVLAYLRYLSQVPIFSLFSSLDLRVPSAIMSIAIVVMIVELIRFPEVSREF
jgi:Gpi18-like mannosyltransferase